MRTQTPRRRSLRKNRDTVARVPHYILITGERGTAQTTIARQIHDIVLDRREFVGVNCKFSSELLESELFGYEKGCFLTGAVAP
ncbi:MAG: sigma 54-interacting transcriptional regulator [Acidobacteria bacterium]|nr:sigma 54-interacting transcriptional regulator [Acidobacteriota bacterium]